jgi:hypothetical protein
MKIKLAGMGGALAMLLIGMSGSAVADTNTYAGALCEPLFTGQAFSRTISFGMGNPNTAGAAIFVCPLVRDNLPAAIPLVTSAAVVVNDFTTTGAVTCTLTSKAAGGGTIASQIRSTTSPGVGIQTLVFGGLATSSTGYLTLHCSLPARSLAGGQGTSRVVSYRASEL